MRGYRKCLSAPLSFESDMDLLNDDLFHQEEQMRGLLGNISAYAEKTGIREYEIVVYAKRSGIYHDNRLLNKIESLRSSPRSRELE